MTAFRALAVLLFSCAVLAAPTAASATTSGDPSGGAVYASAPAPPVAAPAGKPATTAASAGAQGAVVPGTVAKLLPDGTAAAPAEAPAAVKAAVWAANGLTNRPYVYGGGHGSFLARGYDCSGSVSYALHAAGLLASPLDSGSLMRWGARGRGRWITVYSNPGHAYVVIAGLRLDTSSAGVSYTAPSKARERGPRWRPARRSGVGFKRRHPVGL